MKVEYWGTEGAVWGEEWATGAMGRHADGSTTRDFLRRQVQVGFTQIVII